MKKKIYLILILAVFIMTGCGKKDQMTNFIPTPAPEDNMDLEEVEPGEEEVTEGETPVITDATPTPKELHIGQTTTKYVKMDEYGAYLNVRANPSTEGAPVGFLVHGEKIEVIEVVDGWASFAMNNEIRYVNSDFLVDERPEYLEPPTGTPSPAVTPTKAPEGEQSPDTNEAPPEI